MTAKTHEPADDRTPEPSPASPANSTFRLAWQLVRYRPALFGLCFAIWTVIHGTPLVFGVLIGQIFDRLVGDQCKTDSFALCSSTHRASLRSNRDRRQSIRRQPDPKTVRSEDSPIRRQSDLPSAGSFD